MTNNSTKDYTLGFGKAHVGALVAALPGCIIFVLLYAFLWGSSALAVDVPLTLQSIIGLFLVFLAGVIIHEALHAVSWVWLGNIPWKHIHFGFKWATLTPYVHCSVPVTARNYRWGTVIPGIALGLLPLLAGLILQDLFCFYFGMIFTIAAGGDFLILWLLRKVDSTAWVQDHPELIGCRVINSNEKFKQ